MKVLNVERLIPRESEEALLGTFLPESAAKQVLTESADVYAEGELIVRFRKGVIPDALCRPAYETFSAAAQPTNNRGTAAGYFPEGEQLNRNGRVARTVNIPPSHQPQSGIIGYWDRYVRVPYCRQTAFTANKVALWKQALPYIRAVSDVFRRECPERWQAQRDFCDATHPAYVIAGSVFTTVTVNKNWQTAVHRDAGDLPEGFGVMTCLRGGEYRGCYLTWPAYGVGVDMGTGDVCLGNVHLPHANTPIIGRPGKYRRITAVMYCRSMMRHCKSPDEELMLAKHRKEGDPIWPELNKQEEAKEQLWLDL